MRTDMTSVEPPGAKCVATGIAEAGAARKSAIQGVILDYGEVLCLRPAREKVARMAKSIGLDEATFERRYGLERAPYDGGDIDHAAYWARVAGVPALSADLVERLRQQDVEIWNTLNPRMLGWLEELRRAGFKTALLSNMHPDMAVHVRKHFQWIQQLDAVILSCELRQSKPGRAIYETCISRLGLKPAQALFIDDRGENITGARAAGLKAIQFRTVELLRADLAACGFSMMPV